MSLSVGLVGLPNAGKSTLFNALLKKQQAFVASYPFATIEPNIGIVPVPDPRLAQLAQTVKTSEKLDHLPPQVPATVKFVDIAGLVKGAHQGEGLGNQFLAHIREVNLICHVLRAFTDANVSHTGPIDPVADLSTLRTELAMADLSTLEKQAPPRGKVEKSAQLRWQAIEKLTSAVRQGHLASSVSLSPEEIALTSDLFLLTAKPELFALNINESDLTLDHHPKRHSGLDPESSQILKQVQDDQHNRVFGIVSRFTSQAGVGESQVIVISAKVEAELADLTPQEGQEYLSQLGVNTSGLEQLIRSSYRTLGLISFLTAGPKEVRAWTVKAGTPAPQAAGVIHTDFQKTFVKAAVTTFSDFINFGGWPGCKTAGKVRHEGKDYQIQDGEVVEFLIGS
jgi:ribosome-binding ATPase YchF (GTP1/OBG family)